MDKHTEMIESSSDIETSAGNSVDRLPGVSSQSHAGSDSSDEEIVTRKKPVRNQFVDSDDEMDGFGAGQPAAMNAEPEQLPVHSKPSPKQKRLKKRIVLPRNDSDTDGSEDERDERRNMEKSAKDKSGVAGARGRSQTKPVGNSKRKDSSNSKMLVKDSDSDYRSSKASVETERQTSKSDESQVSVQSKARFTNTSQKSTADNSPHSSPSNHKSTQSNSQRSSQTQSTSQKSSQTQSTSQKSSQKSSHMSSKSSSPNNSQKSTQSRSQKSSQSQSKKSSQNSLRNSSPMSSRSSSPNNSHKSTQSQSQKSTPSQSQKSVQNSTPNSHRSISQNSTSSNSRNSSPRSSQRSKTSNSQQSALNSSLNSTMNNSATASLSQESTVSKLDKSLEENKRSQLETSSRDSDSDDTIVNTSRNKSKAFKGKRVFDDDSDSDGSKANNLSAKIKSDSSSESDASSKVDNPEANNKLKSKRRIVQHDDSDDMDTTPKNEKQAVKPRLTPAVSMRFSSEAEKDIPDWKKSILSAGLLDEESSDDGRRVDSPDSPSVRQPSSSGKSKKERRKTKEIAARPKPKTLKSQKAAKEDKEKIHSETQRILRQAHVDLPYHVPRQRTLAEFMRGRTLGAAGGCTSLKSRPQEMQKHWQQIEEREKEAIVFYKSESEPSEDEAEKIGNSVLPHSQIQVPPEDPSLESFSTHSTAASLDVLPDSTLSGVDLGDRPRDSGAVKENNLCSIEHLKSSHLGEQSCSVENKNDTEIENAMSDDVPQQKADVVLDDGDIMQLENKSMLLLGSDNHSSLELQAENPTAVSLESETVSAWKVNPELVDVNSTEKCQAISSFAPKYQGLLDEIDDSNDGSIVFQLSDSDESQHAPEKTENTVLEGSDNLSEDRSKMQKGDNGIEEQTASDTLESLSKVTTSDKLQKGGSGTEEPKPLDTFAILTEVATLLEQQKGVDETEERTVSDTAEISTEVETKREPKPVRRNVFGRDYADLSSDSGDDAAAAGTGKGDERLAKLRKRSLVDVDNVRPRLSGGSDMVIDLDMPTKKSGVIDLLQRFIKHSAKPKTNKTPTEMELSVVSAEKAADGSMEVKKELVTVLLDGGADESRDPVPGAKLKRLRHALEQQMAQRRSAEWQRKMEEEKQNNEVLEDGEKSDCGMLDDEEEMSNSEEDEEDEEEEEEEGELEENDVTLVESKREKSAFVDGEAEVSDDGDDADISDDDEEEEEEEEDKEEEEKTTIQETDDATASQDGNTLLENTQGRSKFRRLKTLDMFDSDEEGYNAITDNAITDKWNGSAMDDSFPTSTMIPAGQRCNSPTPSPTVLSPMKYNRRTGATQEPSFVLPTTPTQRSAPAVDESEFFSTQDYLNEMMNGVPRKPKPVASALKGLSQLFSKPIAADFGDDDDLLGLCSGKFPSQAVAGPFEDDSELLSLCSGRFTPQSQVERQSQVDQSQADQSQVDQSQVDQSQHGVKGGVSLKAQLESQSQRSAREAGEDKGTVSILPAANASVVMTSNQIRLELASSDDEADALFPDNMAERRKKRKLQKKLDFSDDEEADAGDDDKENESNDELGESDPEMVDYDSEENEVPVTDVGAGKHKKSSRAAREFLDAEAELSESEWGSADEDEQGLDQLDRLDGDDEHFDQEEMKEQIGKIHMRQVLDADKREVRMLQELLFEDGDLHSEGGGRERKFRWRNADDGDINDGLRNDDSGGEGGLEDEEEDQQWRIMRHQRETFLREQKEKAEATGQPDVGILADEDSQLLQLGKAALKRIRSVRSQHQLTMTAERSKVAVRKAASESVLSPDPKRSCHPLMKRGSFLARGEQALARLAELTRNSAGTVVLNTKNSRNFVFATISPKEEGDLEEPVKKVTKRKAAQVTPSVLKKTKVADDKSKGRRLFDHLT